MQFSTANMLKNRLSSIEPILRYTKFVNYHLIAFKLQMHPSPTYFLILVLDSVNISPLPNGMMLCFVGRRPWRDAEGEKCSMSSS